MNLNLNKKTRKLACLFSTMFFLSNGSLVNASPLTNQSSLENQEQTSNDKLQVTNDTNNLTNTVSTAKSIYQENDPLIKYKGKWLTDSSTANSGGSAVYSQDKDSSFTFTFMGTGFSLLGYTNNSKGFVNVTVDGTKYICDSYFAGAKYNSKYFTVSDLEKGRHTVTVSVPHQKNTASYGYYVSFDSLEIENGALVPTEVAPQPAEEVKPTSNSYEQDNELINYSGNWKTDYNPNHSGGSSIFSEEKDASMNFTFTGSGFSLSGYTSNSKGKATVIVDDTLEYKIDTYYPGAKYNSEYFTLKNIPGNKHTVKLIVDHEKVSSSFGYYVNFDKIDIFDGELVPNEVVEKPEDPNADVVTSYENDNPLIRYDGNWAIDKSSANSGGNATYSDTLNASFKFSFTGTGFSLSGYRNNSKGIAKVIIDGTQELSVNTFSTEAKYNTEFFKISTLPNTKHTVKVIVPKEKDPNSYGYYINFDKLDIFNGSLNEVYNINTYEEDNSYIDYSGKWLTDNNDYNSKGTSKFSDATNACVTFSFDGTGFAWYGFANNSKGIANIYVDDKKYQIDTYSSDSIYKKQFFKLENLDEGNHIVRIEVSGGKFANSYGPYINIDKLEVFDGKLVPICPAISYYQEDDALLIYNGEWTKDFNGYNSNGSSRYSGTAGNSINFAFNGTGFKWYSYSNNSKGIANIYIDGKKYSTDTYCSSAQYQCPVFEIRGLDQGKHVVKIEVSGTKNDNSYGYYINIDRLEVFDGIMTSIYPTNYYEEDNELIEYNGNWNIDSNVLNSSGISKFASSNCSATFCFEGSGFRWYGYANNSKGIAKIYIDGKEYSKDTYQSYQQYQAPFYEILFDKPGKHKVTIKVSGQQNKDSYGPYINFDKIDIYNGELIPVSAIPTFEETSPLIKFNGNWSSDAISKFSGNLNDSFEFKFKGTGFVWYGYANNSKGIADIYVDGIKVSHLDTYNPSQDYQHPFYKLDSLDDIEHTVKVVVCGEKNPMSYGYYLNVDKIDIYGTLLDME